MKIILVAVLLLPASAFAFESSSTVSETRSPSGLRIVSEIGLSRDSYAESTYINLRQTSVRLRADVNYRFDESRWALGTSWSLRALPVAMNNSPTAKFLNGDAFASWNASDDASSVRLAVHGGAFFRTTPFMSGFGYNDVKGPLLFPSITSSFSGDGELSVYAKALPAFGSITGWETGLGASYSFGASSNAPIRLSLEYSGLRYDAKDQFGEAVPIRGESLAFGIGYPL